jgi:hypothetical protein
MDRHTGPDLARSSYRMRPVYNLPGVDWQDQNLPHALFAYSISIRYCSSQYLSVMPAK